VAFVTLSRTTGIALAVSAIAVGAMAIDHLVGTESEPGEEDSFPVDPVAFVIGSAVSLALVALLFAVVVRRTEAGEPERAPRRAFILAVLAVLSLPMLFLGVPFAIAGAAVALGLLGREGGRSGIATAAVVVGALVIVVGASAYLAALVA
jgi:hypothetical protein